MTIRLPLVDAPLLDVPAELHGPPEPTRVPCVAVVPVRDTRAAFAFAEHVVRAARVAGARPTVLVSERAEDTTGVDAAAPPLRTRFVDAGATRVLVTRSDAASAVETARAALESANGLVVAIGCDVPSAVVPTFTVAVTDGRALTGWSAMARAVRSRLDAELVDPRSDFARGLVSALDRQGLLGPKAE